MTDLEKNNDDGGLDSDQSNESTTLSTLQFNAEGIVNLIGLVGTVLNIWFFIDTLYKIYVGEIGFGLYLQAGAIVLLVLFCLYLTQYGWSAEDGAIVFVFSAFGIVLSLILIGTFYVTSHVANKHGFDLFLANKNPLEYNWNSLLGISFFMFISAALGELFFLRHAHQAIKIITTIPKLILFTYLFYYLFGEGHLLSDFNNLSATPNNVITSYATGTVMFLILIGLSKKQLQNN